MTFSFGGSSTPASSTGFSFGATTPAASTPSTGFSFGSTPASTTPSTAFSLGSKPAATTPSTGFSFGSTPAATTPTSGFSFGSTSPTSFGAKPAGGMTFGTPATAPAQPAATSLFGNTAVATPAQQVSAAIQRIAAEYQSDNFKHVLYNLVDAVPPNLQRPADVSEKLWNQAVADNPDRSRLVPVQLSGFEELKNRLNEHKKIIAEHEKFLLSVQKLITQLLQKNERQTQPKILQFKEKHMEQCHRLLKIVSKVECFQNRGKGMTPEEELFHAKLTAMQRELNKPTQFQGRLNELSSLVSMQEDISPSVPEELDAESAKSIRLYLEHQKGGIEEVLKILKEDVRDVEITLQSLKDGAASQ